MLKTEYIDLVLVTETWLNSDFPNSLFSNTQFSLSNQFMIHRCDRENGEHGGVCMFIKASIQSTLVDKISIDKVIEVLVVDIFGEHQSKHRIVLIYRSPLSKLDSVQKMCDFVHLHTNVSFPIMLIGDTNYPNARWDNCQYSNKGLCKPFSDLTILLGLKQIVDQPTRGNKVLDTIFVQDPVKVSQLSVMDPFDCSDHNEIRFSLNIKFVAPTKYQRLDFKNSNFDAMEAFLSNIDWFSMFLECDSLQDRYDLFQGIMEHCFDRFVPKIEVNLNRRCPDRFESYSLAKKRAYRKFKRSGNPTDLLEYKNIANKLRNALRDNCLNNERKVLTSGNSKKFYSYIKTKLSSKCAIPVLVNRSNVMCSSLESKVEAFSEQFKSVFTNDNGILPEFAFRTQKTKSSVSLSIDIVRDALLKVPKKTSCGPDNIPSLVLSKLNSCLSEPLFYLFSESLVTDSFQCNGWKLE